MSIIDKAKAHFDKIGAKKIKIPEWDSVIYATPLTLDEKRILVKFSDGSNAEFGARMIIMKSMDKDGKKVFDLDDKAALMGRTHSGVIEYIVSEINDVNSLEKIEEK
jgi:hypothetical protein